MDEPEEVMESDPSLPQPLINVYATKNEWLQHDPVLKDGQLGIEYDPATRIARIKAGWSGLKYSELDYIGGEQGLFAKTMAAEQGATPPLESIPAPDTSGTILVALGIGALGWQVPESGSFTIPNVYRPRVLRQPVGISYGPPAQLPDGQLAVNLGGHVTGEQRPSLYIGGQDDIPILILSENDLLINLRPRAETVWGGTDVASAVNALPEPLVVAESELWVISYGPWIYLFGGLPGRYGGVNFNGPGGPGSYVQMSQFVVVSTNYPPATQQEILSASAPEKSVNADSALYGALTQMFLNNGVSVRPDTQQKPNQLVLTQPDGRIDLSLLPSIMLGLTYAGVTNPSQQFDYPPSPSTNSLYVVSGLSGPYEFTKGDLDGLTCFNSDQMIWNGVRWELIGFRDISGLMRSDGSVPMQGDLNVGGHVVEQADGIIISESAFMAARQNQGTTAKGLILDAGTF